MTQAFHSFDSFDSFDPLDPRHPEDTLNFMHTWCYKWPRFGFASLHNVNEPSKPRDDMPSFFVAVPRKQKWKEPFFEHHESMSR